MRKAPFEPCIPTRATEVPAGRDWLHEVKYDGYRLIVRRDGKRVRLFTRNGNDWTDRYPLIVESALRSKSKSFVIDGEAVLLGVDGVSDFDGLHSRNFDDEVQLYAFDVLAQDGDDLRSLPLGMRKANLARLLAGRPDGIFLAPFEQGEIGPDLFRKVCEFGWEGIVSKRRERAYRAGSSSNWIKVKNPGHPAMKRIERSFRTNVSEHKLTLRRTVIGGDVLDNEYSVIREGRSIGRIRRPPSGSVSIPAGLGRSIRRCRSRFGATALAARSIRPRRSSKTPGNGSTPR
jgi:bifunctional non-homologous end joining protein LigD